MDKHDKHYQGQGPYEPIKVIEHFLKVTGVPPLVAYSLGQVLRYILRAGQKEGQPWQKDIEKGLNYMHRALKGEWVDDEQASREMEKAIIEEVTTPKKLMDGVDDFERQF